MNQTLPEELSDLSVSSIPQEKPINLSLTDMDLDKNDMSSQGSTEAESEIIYSDQSLPPEPAYTESCFGPTKRLIINCFLGLIMDSLKSGILSIESE